MRNKLRNWLQIKNSFLLVLFLVLSLIGLLSFLLTRLALANIDMSEDAKRSSVRTFVTNSFAEAVRGVMPGAIAIGNDSELIERWAAKDRNGLLAAAAPIFGQLQQVSDVKQLQFNGADFKVFLRVHNPSVFGDDVTTSRPLLVECLTRKQSIEGLEQGKSGYGFRAAVPVAAGNTFLGCAELGANLSAAFLQLLDANYPGRWAIVNLGASTVIGRDLKVLATLNEPSGSQILTPDFQTAPEIASAMAENRSVYSYSARDRSMTLYMPIKNYRGEVALYVRYVSSTPYYDTIRSMVFNAVFISIAGLLFTAAMLWFLYKGIRGPVQQLVQETERIKVLDLREDVSISASLADLQKLVVAISDMKVGLRSFQKYVPANLVRQLIDTKQEAKIGGRLQELTIFFSDIVNFTTITENLAPNDLAHLLSEYFTIMTNGISRHNGTVDKYIGDSVMAFWGAPNEIDDHALCACRAALECRREIAAFNQRMRNSQYPAFVTRIGIATGEVVVGNIGSDQRLNYSVIGDPVNLASRLEGLNTVYGTGVLINEDCYLACARFIEARAIDVVRVKGKLEPVRIFELIGERGDISPHRKESLKMFDRAQKAYFEADIVRARALFSELQARQPEDAVVSLYLQRCADSLIEPPRPG
jgi:class 3 adenylate cyclase